MSSAQPFARLNLPFAEKPAAGGTGRAVSVSQGTNEVRAVSEGEDYRSLMTRYQAGDLQAFEMLYRALAPRLRALVGSLAPDLASDEQLVEDIFIGIHDARSSYHPRHPFEPWLEAVVRHVIARRRRSTSRRFGRVFARSAPRVVERGVADHRAS